MLKPDEPSYQLNTFYRHLTSKEHNLTNNIMVLFGDDFFGENFIGTFMNIEVLMERFHEQYGKEYRL